MDGDTVYHTVPDFAFHNQDSQLVNLETFKDEVFVIDLFFTSCPTICPKVTKQMLRLYEKYKEDDRISLISLTIDPAKGRCTKAEDLLYKS